jgi:3,5-epimerase/4-reductase
MIPNTVLVYGGKSGWIAGMLKAELAAAFPTCSIVDATARIEDTAGVAAELDAVRPDCVILSAGLTGRPNIDSLEDDKARTSLVNVAGAVGVACQCALRDIYVVTFATGCIYEYDAAHPIGGLGFKETDPPNFFGSYYSRTKAAAEAATRELPGHLMLRVRMPISCDGSPRCFVTKIARYAQVVDVPNSVSVLPDLLPVVPRMIAARVTGVFNFVNPGPVSHGQILLAYKLLVDAEFTYKIMDMATHDQVVKARRSNNCLDCTKLEAVVGKLPTALESITKLLAKHTPCLRPL